jgi:acetyl esterase/lipase
MTPTNAGPYPYAYDDELLAVIPKIPVLDLDDPASARATAAAFGCVTGKRAEFTRLEAVDHNLDDRVRVRVFRPRQRESPTAAVLYAHGGGFVLGLIATEEANATELARRLGITLVSVEYRRECVCV